MISRTQQSKKQGRGQAGFIRWILIIIVIIILLSYFGVDLRGFFEDDQTQSNFSFIFDALEKVWDFVVGVWDAYVQEPAQYVWDFFKDVLWDRWIEPLIDSIRNSEPSDTLEEITIE